LGRYRIETVLGQGQAGIVYLAFDTAIERPVAIKCLRADRPEVKPGKQDKQISVLFEEAKVIGQLSHSHITAIYDMGQLQGNSYIVMEYVKGETLKSRLAKSRRASVAEILRFIVMVARALHYVHQRGILHGDIKPANLIVTPEDTPKIMDFGVARRSQANSPVSWSLSEGDSIWGTPGYLAPEQLADDKIDARADVFSLGVIAYEWLAGRKPFWGETLDATLSAVLRGRVTPLCELGDFELELSKVIDRSLARKPGERFTSADALADALEVCLEAALQGDTEDSASRHGKRPGLDIFPGLQRQNVLFSDFSREELTGVLEMSRRESYRAGEPIIKEGMGGSTMYVLVQGRVSVRKRSGDGDVEIRQIAAGDTFGEMAVVSQMPRSATVVALEPSEAIAISGAVLRTSSPILSMKLYRNIAALLSERVRDVDAQVVTLLQAGTVNEHLPKASAC
jgi:serine/threonine-protein kinase